MHSRSLTEGYVPREMLLFALPILLTNVLQAMNGSVNAMWVGHYLGEAALVAVSNANLIMHLLLGAAYGVSTAATILVSRSIGAGDVHYAKCVAATSVLLFAGASAGVAVAGWMLSDSLLSLMRVPSASVPMAASYMRVMFLALPSVFIYMLITSLLRGTGDSKSPLFLMLLTTAIEVMLNPILILGAGLVPKMGIAGSAVAMLVAQTVGLAVLILKLYSYRHPLRWCRDDQLPAHVGASVLSTLLRKGIPIGAEMLIVSLSGMLMMVLVNRFGVDTAAAFGVSLQVWLYVQMPAVAIGTAVGTMVAMNLGRNQCERVSSLAAFGLTYSVALTGISVLGVYAFDSYLYRIFLPAGSLALQIATHINSIVAWSSLFMSVSMVLFSIVRANGVVIVPLMVYMVALFAVRIPIAAILSDRWKVDAIWWSFPLSLAFTAIASTVYYKCGRWRSESHDLSEVLQTTVCPMARRD